MKGSNVRSMSSESRKPMKQIDERDTMREEYDFSEGIRGKHYEAYSKGTNMVLIEPDLAKLFKDSAAVNAALNKLIEIAPDYVSNISVQQL